MKYTFQLFVYIEIRFFETWNVEGKKDLTSV